MHKDVKPQRGSLGVVKLFGDSLFEMLDALTCAGNLENLAAVNGGFRHVFVMGNFQ